MKSQVLSAVIAASIALIPMQDLAKQAIADDGVVSLIPHPYLERTQGALTKQLGSFGESFVDAGLRARGFEVIDGNVGVNGIDRIAFKRSATGTLSDLRFIEVKTRQFIPTFDLSVTKNNGSQLSDQWIQNNLGRIVREHSDPKFRRLAAEVLQTMKAQPGIVRRELHGIAVEVDKYVIMIADESGRITGVAAEGRLTKLLKMLSTRGTSDSVRTAALRHLSQFDQLRTAVASASGEAITTTKASTQGLEAVVRNAQFQGPARFTEPRSAVVVTDAKAARHWATRLATHPGVIAAGMTLGVDEAFTGWDYYRGTISNGDFQRESLQNGAKAAAVGIATQLVYILAPTPHGLVLIGVGIVAYVATDQAIAAYDNAFVPKAPAATELGGIVPEAFINTSLLDDVATGGNRRSHIP